MQGVLQKVIQRVDLKQLSALPGPKVSNAVKENHDSSPTITQAWFWPRIGEFLMKNDVVITETGTANFGIWDTKFPPGVTALSQVLWGSIGYSVGACQGAALAVRDAGSDRRTILFVGDGSFQLTAQEVSTMIRLGLKPIIFCICNDGYTIERFIHGMDAEYNDVQEWRYKDVLQTFGAKEGSTKAYQVKTKSEIEALLKDKEFNDAGKLQFVEVYMDKKDSPRALKMTAEAAAKNNEKE